jgi:hypothetical protein
MDIWYILAAVGLIISAAAGHQSLANMRDDRETLGSAYPAALRDEFLRCVGSALVVYGGGIWLTLLGFSLSTEGVSAAISYIPLTLFWLVGWIVCACLPVAVSSALVYFGAKSVRTAAMAVVVTLLPPLSLLSVFGPMLRG